MMLRIPVLAALLLGSSAYVVAGPVVREQATVAVDGRSETWQLVWQEKPEPVCGPEDVLSAITCPCSGFAYGESGRLGLVRRRPGAVTESVDLTPFFDADFSPAARPNAVLQLWPLLHGDIDRTDDPALPAEVRKRAPVSVMNLHDYDRDGRASEFLLQVGTMPCGKHLFIAVGVSRSGPKLHAFRTGRGFGSLELPIHAWDALRKPGTHSVVEWECDDHASGVHQELVVSAAQGVITAKRREYACPHDPEHPRLLKEESL